MYVRQGRLNPSERITLRMIEAAAECGGRAPTCDEIREELGCSAVSTTVSIIAKLERRGLIEVDRYQRERQITIKATGKKTSPVKTAAPMWRTIPRPKKIPRVSAQSIAERKPDLAKQMSSAASDEGLSLHDFLSELIWVGWLLRMNERG